MKAFVPSLPFQVVWNITNACNFKCAHCYEDAGKKSTKELSNQEIIVDDLKVSENCFRGFKFFVSKLLISCPLFV